MQAAMELGYSSMKHEQVEVAVALIEGKDVFAILPTDFGKSLCYACLPVAFDKCRQYAKVRLCPTSKQQHKQQHFSIARVCFSSYLHCLPP